MTSPPVKAFTAAACLSALLALAACGNTVERLASVGRAPPMSGIENPYGQPG